MPCAAMTFRRPRIFCACHPLSFAERPPPGRSEAPSRVSAGSFSKTTLPTTWGGYTLPLGKRRFVAPSWRLEHVDL